MADRHTYLAVNILFAVLILAVFAYAYALVPTGAALGCVHLKWLGKPCASCGLSRGFAAILHGRMGDARLLNRNSILVFSFFTFELLVRFLALLLIFTKIVNLKKYILVDAVSSAILFLYCFKELILQTFSMIFKLN